jgi:hypothetical protein
MAIILDKEALIDHDIIVKAVCPIENVWKKE